MWLDKICVPQDGSVLQKTLLSRMMAVYASSACTLVLRSRELERSRYHQVLSYPAMCPSRTADTWQNSEGIFMTARIMQGFGICELSLMNCDAVVVQRGWTVQEYCVCNRLCVMDEPSGLKPENVTTSCFKMSVYRGEAEIDFSEERYFQDLRSWHISRSPLCRPVWLYEAPSHGVLEEALLTFMDLIEKVSTQQPKDLVRALVPMLTNSPAETEADLMHLLQALDSLGQQNDRIRQEIMKFKARSMHASVLSQPDTGHDSSPQATNFSHQTSTEFSTRGAVSSYHYSSRESLELAALVTADETNDAHMGSHVIDLIQSANGTSARSDG